MTAKEQKFLSLFADAARQDLPRSGDAFLRAMSGLVRHDFMSAVLAWEYFLSERDIAMNKDKALAGLLTDGVEKIFEAQAASRFVRLLTDSAPVRDAIYRRSATALSRPETAGYAAQMLLSGRDAESEELMKSAMKNPSGGFGPFMSAVVDRLIIELSKKNPSRPSFPKKLAAHVLAFSEKIKGPEKAFIAQRIREL